jgi:hypothetical protein
MGTPTSVALLLGFVAVCAAEVVVGVLLWRDAASALWLALALLPVELAFWIGFALPVGPLPGLARTALVITVLVSGDRHLVGPRPQDVEHRTQPVTYRCRLEKRSAPVGLGACGDPDPLEVTQPFGQQCPGEAGRAGGDLAEKVREPARMLRR